MSDAETETKTTMLVRIKPNSPRKSHTAFGVTINAEDGWCELERSVAMKLSREPLHDGCPENSPLVFDVKDHYEAAVVAEAEKIKIEPAGTVERPKVKLVAVPTPEATEPPRRGFGGSRGGR